ncbi:tRNA pseudouridine(55) synthase TruB [Candidatus Peregrinibacteria bacterium]|nr:tRNA pseudouridine(55) synthase TruB [Candidatus Peregrinibacteria bacterium]
MLDGLLVINKPKSWTSFDVVAKIRNKFGVKKVGHTGTLDPMATGVLVLCLGKATKLAQQITDTDKEYIAEITFGATSTTDDAEGEISFGNSKLETQNSKITSESKNNNSNLNLRSSSLKAPGLEEIMHTLKRFTGSIMQVPPNFSAKKIKGKRAYKLAREGKEVKLEPREVTISEIEILNYKWPVLSLRIACGKGTYIRSIARDLGQALKVGGYLTALQRTKVGQYTIDKAVTIEDADESNVLPI